MMPRNKATPVVATEGVKGAIEKPLVAPAGAIPPET